MATKNYGKIDSIEELQALVVRLESSDILGFDIETGYDGPDKAKGALNPDYGFIVGFSITDNDSWARYVPLRHDLGPNLSPDEVWPIVKSLLETKKIVAHNAKFEMKWMRRVGINLNIFSDTMLEEFCLSELKYVGLKNAVKERFGHVQTELKSLFSGWSDKKLETVRFNLLDVSQPEVVEYACEDAAWCLSLHNRNYDKIKDNFIFKLEMSLISVVADMEDVGVMIDWDFLRKNAVTCEVFMDRMLEEIKADLSAMIGTKIDININSSRQLAGVLYGQLGMKTSRKSKTGADSTDAIALAALSEKYEVVRKILDWRELQALHKRYLDKWPREFSGASDGRAHADFRQHGAGTGRFAVNDPPLQQCPKPRPYELKDGSKFECNFRDAIMARPGYYLLDFDYSQIELRVMAGLSQEPTLMSSFDKDDDVHSATASMMLGVPRGSISKDQRAIGKTMNFALLYGMGVKSLSERLAITRERATELYDAYFANFPSIHSWMEKCKREGKNLGYTVSKFGRKYTIWEFQSSNMAIYSKGERVCVNAPVQGGAADYMKVAMARVSKALKARGWWKTKVSLVMNNHDALTFEVDSSLSPEELVPIIREAVEFKVEGFPKIVAEFSVGQRWGSMEDWPPVAGEGLPNPAADDVELDESGEPRLGTIQANVEEALAGVPKQSQTFVVELSQMPTTEQFRRFLDLISARPGSNAFVIKTPEGEVTVDAATSLNLDDSPNISMIFGGALVTVPEGEVDAQAIAGNIQF